MNMGRSPDLAPGADIFVHYLGHASFVLQFDNGVSILTDYGTSYSYGLDSPIYDLEGFRPTIVIYSHQDTDHYRGVSFEDAQVLTGQGRLSLSGITIDSFPATERTPGDNASFRIGYRDFTILHLGDAQGDIARIQHPETRKRLKALLPAAVDLLLLPIGWTRTIIEEAEATLDLLAPKRAIPMHYWSPQEKAAFLTYLESQNETAGKKRYHVHRLDQAQHAISSSETEVEPIRVFSLEPAPFRQSGGG
jgi:L-ascorbate metabolism protein UlaG (beta-lactamase superfamily)